MPILTIAGGDGVVNLTLLFSLTFYPRMPSCFVGLITGPYQLPCCLCRPIFITICCLVLLKLATMAVSRIMMIIINISSTSSFLCIQKLGEHSLGHAIKSICSALLYSYLLLSLPYPLPWSMSFCLYIRPFPQKIENLSFDILIGINYYQSNSL